MLLVALCSVATPAKAVQIVPAGGTAIVSNGVFNLACTDLTVAGVLETGTGTYVDVHNVTVGPSGVIQGAGTIRYSGTLTVTGTVQPDVKLLLNLPTNVACPGPRPPEVAVVHPAPALDAPMLVLLAILLLLLALFALHGRTAPQRNRVADGVDG